MHTSQTLPGQYRCSIPGFLGPVTRSSSAASSQNRPARTGCCVHRHSVCPQDQGQLPVPITLLFGDEDGELRGEGTVKPLHQPITLRI